MVDGKMDDEWIATAWSIEKVKIRGQFGESSEQREDFSGICRY